MKKVKDKFSVQAESYKKHRPVYPVALYEYILDKVDERQCCWDCGTGNGQVALVLSDYFQKVFATDISQKQLGQAPKKDNITYRVERAERTSFNEDQFDLITVAQAIHWFDHASFYKEVRRVAKPNALFAVWGYGLLQIGEPYDYIIDKFYSETLGRYWDKERRHIDAEYETIHFPFMEEKKPSENLKISVALSLKDIEGFFNSWSAVQNYISANKVNPVPQVIGELRQLWKDHTTKVVTYPLFTKIGRVIK